MNRIEDVTNYITECDEEVGKALQLELGRQRRNLELIASENIVSPAVMLAMGTVPTNKYAEGYPGKRYYGGCEDVDILENLAIERAKKLFGCDHVCVQPHSGANANTAVYQALIKPGDTVMGLNLAHGGHLTHGSPVNLSGILYNFVPYNVNDDGVLDYDEIRKLAHECKPKMIVAGASAYPREIRFDIFADIAKEVGAYIRPVWTDRSSGTEGDGNFKKTYNRRKYSKEILSCSIWRRSCRNALHRIQDRIYR